MEHTPKSLITIPKIIHQIYEDPKGPSQELLDISNSWKLKHPNWLYYFWDKNKIDHFLRTYFQDFISYYNSYIFPVQRWDAIRYLILYIYGGMYVDFDYECLNSIESLLVDSDCCIGLEPHENASFYSKDFIIGNALMATTPSHPFFKMIIDDLILNNNHSFSKWDGIQIIESTGPFLVTRVYKNYPHKDEIKLLPSEFVTPLTFNEVRDLVNDNITVEIEQKVEKAFAIHYFSGSWLSQLKNNKL